MRVGPDPQQRGMRPTCEEEEAEEAPSPCMLEVQGQLSQQGTQAHYALDERVPCYEPVLRLAASTNKAHFKAALALAVFQRQLPHVSKVALVQLRAELVKLQGDTEQLEKTWSHRLTCPMVGMLSPSKQAKRVQGRRQGELVQLPSVVMAAISHSSPFAGRA